ncbi:ABC transporter substrate-binding protein [Salininema proteolyticum]|uniref:ABC transporter substrate-binding protein n=1 Tax=Salininema proteolyticum TaxID=1607685 RepID=A0ABV8TUM7_9ACTN
MSPSLTRRTLLTSGGVAAAGVLGLTACGGAEDGELVVAMAQTPLAGLSPLSDDAFHLSRWAVVESLVGLDDQGAPVPALAESWEQRDDTTWSFTLRDGVVFHNGEKLTAEAAATALTAAFEATARPRAISGLELAATAADDRTVAITLDAPDPTLPQRLSSPQLSILAPTAYEGDSIDPVGNGTGPFAITDASRDSATMKRFEDYHGEAAALPGFRADYVPDAATRVAALKSGEADVIEAVPYGQTGSLPESQRSSAPTARTVGLYLNTAGGPLADEGLRSAVASAIDAEPIVEDIYEGQADRPAGLFGPALAWADDHLPVELPRAAEPSGTALAIATYSNRAELPEVLTVLADQLTRAGFDVATEVRDYDDIESDMLAGEFDGFLLSRSVVLDSGDPQTFFASDFTSGGDFNISRLSDSAIDSAVAGIAPLEDLGERHAAILDVEAEILSRAAIVPVAHERLVAGVGDRVSHVAADPRERDLVTGATEMEQ